MKPKGYGNSSEGAKNALWFGNDGATPQQQNQKPTNSRNVGGTDSVRAQFTGKGSVDEQKIGGGIRTTGLTEDDRKVQERIPGKAHVAGPESGDYSFPSGGKGITGQRKGDQSTQEIHPQGGRRQYGDPNASQLDVSDVGISPIRQRGEDTSVDGEGITGGRKNLGDPARQSHLDNSFQTRSGDDASKTPSNPSGRAFTNSLRGPEPKR